MSLDLAPETEHILEQEAVREGVSVDTLIRRTFAPHPQKFGGSQHKSESIIPADDPVLAFLNARIQEAEKASPEEIAVADAEYHQWQQDMDETRLANDERLLFPDSVRP